MVISCETEQGEWVDCPIFSGINLEEWIVAIKIFFHQFQIPEVQHVNLASHHIGVLSTCVKQYEENTSYWSWSVFVGALRIEFVKANSRLHQVQSEEKTVEQVNQREEEQLLEDVTSQTTIYSSDSLVETVHCSAVHIFDKVSNDIVERQENDTELLLNSSLPVGPQSIFRTNQDEVISYVSSFFNFDKYPISAVNGRLITRSMEFLNFKFKDYTDTSGARTNVLENVTECSKFRTRRSTDHVLDLWDGYHDAHDIQNISILQELNVVDIFFSPTTAPMTYCLALPWATISTGANTHTIVFKKRVYTSHLFEPAARISLKQSVLARLDDPIAVYGNLILWNRDSTQKAPFYSASHSAVLSETSFTSTHTLKQLTMCVGAEFGAGIGPRLLVRLFMDKEYRLLVSLHICDGKNVGLFNLEKECARALLEMLCLCLSRFHNLDELYHVSNARKSSVALCYISPFGFVMSASVGRGVQPLLRPHDATKNDKSKEFLTRLPGASQPRTFLLRVPSKQIYIPEIIVLKCNVTNIQCHRIIVVGLMFGSALLDGCDVKEIRVSWMFRYNYAWLWTKFRYDMVLLLNSTQVGNYDKVLLNFRWHVPTFMELIGHEFAWAEYTLCISVILFLAGQWLSTWKSNFLASVTVYHIETLKMCTHAYDAYNSLLCIFCHDLGILQLTDSPNEVQESSCVVLFSQQKLCGVNSLQGFSATLYTTWIRVHAIYKLAQSWTYIWCNVATLGCLKFWHSVLTSRLQTSVVSSSQLGQQQKVIVKYQLEVLVQEASSYINMNTGGFDVTGSTYSHTIPFRDSKRLGLLLYESHRISPQTSRILQYLGWRRSLPSLYKWLAIALSDIREQLSLMAAWCISTFQAEYTVQNFDWDSTGPLSIHVSEQGFVVRIVRDSSQQMGSSAVRFLCFDPGILRMGKEQFRDSNKSHTSVALLFTHTKLRESSLIVAPYRRQETTLEIVFPLQMKTILRILYHDPGIVLPHKSWDIAKHLAKSILKLVLWCRCGLNNITDWSLRFLSSISRVLRPPEVHGHSFDKNCVCKGAGQLILWPPDSVIDTNICQPVHSYAVVLVVMFARHGGDGLHALNVVASSVYFRFQVHLDLLVFLVWKDSDLENVLNSDIPRSDMAEGLCV